MGVCILRVVCSLEIDIQKCVSYWTYKCSADGKARHGVCYESLHNVSCDFL